MSGKGSIFILLIASSLLMASCQRYDIQEVLLSHEEASLTWKGDVQILYEPGGWHILPL